MKLTRPKFDTLLLGRDVEDALEALQEDGTLASTFPEVQALVGFGGGDTGHKDLWGHTKRVVAQTKRLPLLRWAALFHDVGKVKCFTRVDGEIAFHGHEAVSAKLFRDASRRTNLFNRDEYEEIRYLIYNLGHIEGYIPSWTDSAVRRLYKEVGAEHFLSLIALSRADITTKNKGKRMKLLYQIHELKTRALELARIDAIPAALPSGLGDVLTAELGIPPSKALGVLMNKLRAAVEAGELQRQATTQDILAFIKERNLV